MGTDVHSVVLVSCSTIRSGAAYPLSVENSVFVMSVAEYFVPAGVKILIVDGLNMRFRHYFNVSADCQTLRCCMQVAARLHLRVEDVMILPELDQWQYSHGPAYVCSTFVLQVLKHAGIFGALGEQINFNEFTPKDLYQLQIFDGDWVPPEKCFEFNSKRLPYCQITGRHQLELNEFNSVAPYSHMNEGCEALPPEFRRSPPGC